ncbi:MAG: type IV pilus secretin PilQ [Smithellaceae bacterium]
MRRSISNAIHLKSLIGVMLLIITFGCAGDQTSLKSDPFFEKWNTLADDSKGHSPSASSKKHDLALQQETTQKTAALIGEEVKTLPGKRINLMMRQADIKAVLRALARSVNINILVKNTLEGDINVDFRDVAWDQAFTGLLRTYGLSYRWEGEILRVMTLEDIEQDLKQKVSIRDTQWVEPLLQPQFIKIDFADAKKLSENLVDFLTKDKNDKPRGTIKVDDHNNALIISAIRDDMDRIMSVIREVDRPTPQVLIKANIVETTKNVARDLGVRWGGWNSGNLGGSESLIATGGAGAPLGGIGSRGFGVNFPAGTGKGDALTGTPLGTLALMFGTIGGNLLELELQALQKDNKLNILSSPSITTLDNQKAYTENGARVPYATLDTSVTPPTRTVKFEDVVLRLEITPHVIDGKKLKMKILVKKDEVDPINALDDGTPFIIKKQTETVLIVHDGETIVISGLTKQTNAAGDAGWPWLKDVPVLGWLFKADNKSESMEEVLIFITPSILQVAGADRHNRSSGKEGEPEKISIQN